VNGLIRNHFKIQFWLLAALCHSVQSSKNRNSILAIPSGSADILILGLQFAEHVLGTIKKRGDYKSRHACCYCLSITIKWQKSPLLNV
jgi:hypothetical protein